MNNSVRFGHCAASDRFAVPVCASKVEQKILEMILRKLKEIITGAFLYFMNG